RIGGLEVYVLNRWDLLCRANTPTQLYAKIGKKQPPRFRHSSFVTHLSFVIGHSSVVAHFSFHSGRRPGVHGAPASSSAFSRLLRSTSIKVRSLPSWPDNSSPATLYEFMCVPVGLANEDPC